MFRIYEEEYTIDLRNASLMTADIDIEFLEDLEEFQIDKTSMRLEVCIILFIYVSKVLLYTFIKINMFINIHTSLELETT